ncbi:hypothetical protein IWZ00DRAFT_371686 [Phyllosticta capitalensis]
MPAIPPIFDNDSPSQPKRLSSSGRLSLFGSHRILPDGGSLFASSPSSSHLVRRQQFRQEGSSSGYIPLVYDNLNSGPSPGAVVGIVLGSVIGFLLIVWLFYAIAAMGGGTRAYADEEVVVRERRPRSTRSRRSVRRTSRPEIREVSRSPGRRQRIVVEERRTSVPPAPRPRSRSVVVEERVTDRRVDGDDIVEVIEETSPPRRSRRNSGYRRPYP